MALGWLKSRCTEAQKEKENGVARGITEIMTDVIIFQLWQASIWKIGNPLVDVSETMGTFGPVDFYKIHTFHILID